MAENQDPSRKPPNHPTPAEASEQEQQPAKPNKRAAIPSTTREAESAPNNPASEANQRGTDLPHMLTQHFKSTEDQRVAPVLLFEINQT